MELVILAAAIAVYLLWPRKKADTAQDLIEFREIHPDGLIELPGNKYRLVLEVESVNLALKSTEEQAAIWLGFRNLANALNLPHTWLVQTRYLDLKDYLSRYRKMGARYGKDIAGYVNRLSDFLQSESEDKQQRSRRIFLILKTDPASGGVESGIMTDHPLVNASLGMLNRIGQSKVPIGDLRRLAHDQLFEAAATVQGVLTGLEIRARVLDRARVLELLYQTFNRDMAAAARLAEADQDGVFSLFTRSETPEIFEKEMRRGA